MLSAKILNKRYSFKRYSLLSHNKRHRKILGISLKTVDAISRLLGFGKVRAYTDGNPLRSEVYLNGKGQGISIDQYESLQRKLESIQQKMENVLCSCNISLNLADIIHLQIKNYEARKELNRYKDSLTRSLSQDVKENRTKARLEKPLRKLYNVVEKEKRLCYAKLSRTINENIYYNKSDDQKTLSKQEDLVPAEKSSLCPADQDGLAGPKKSKPNLADIEELLGMSVSKSNLAYTEDIFGLREPSSKTHNTKSLFECLPKKGTSVTNFESKNNFDKLRSWKTSEPDRFHQRLKRLSTIRNGRLILDGASQPSENYHFYKAFQNFNPERVKINTKDFLQGDDYERRDSSYSLTKEMRPGSLLVVSKHHKGTMKNLKMFIHMFLKLFNIHVEPQVREPKFPNNEGNQVVATVYHPIPKELNMSSDFPRINEIEDDLWDADDMFCSAALDPNEEPSNYLSQGDCDPWKKVYFDPFSQFGK